MSNNRIQRSIIFELSDNSRKASVILPVDRILSDLLEDAIFQWNLPSNSNYAFRLERDGQELDLCKTLLELNILDDDVLELYPILEAGGYVFTNISAPVIIPDEESLTVVLVRVDLIHKLEEYRSDQLKLESFIWTFIGAILGILINWITAETLIMSRVSIVVLTILAVMTFVSWQLVFTYQKRADKIKKDILKSK